MTNVYKIKGVLVEAEFRSWHHLMNQTRAELERLNEEFRMRDNMIRQEMSKQAKVYYENMLAALGVDCPGAFETGEWYLNSEFYDDFGDAYLVHDPDAREKAARQNQIVGRPPGMPEVDTDGRPN